MQILKKVSFWVGLYFVFNLFFISTPPIEKSHNWRQTLTNTIARNYANEETTFPYPMVDHAGDRNGIIGAEFPIYNYTIGKCIQWFGFKHWYGRLINLIFTCLGILAFSSIIKLLFNEKTAFYSGMFLLFSVWFTFGRKIMPDTLSLSLVIIGIWAGLHYLASKKWWYLLLMPLGIALGLLIKMPAAVVLAPFALILLNGQWKLTDRLLVSALTIAAIVPAWYWFFKWVPVLNENGFMLFFPRSLAEGSAEIATHWKAAINNFTFNSFLSFVGFAVFLIGLIYASVKKQIRPLAIFIVGFVTFIYFIIKTGITFPYHSYYMVPFVPLMAMMAGFVLSKMSKNSYALLILSVFGIESIANQQDDLRIREKDYTFLELESIADSIAGRDQKIICNGGVSPTTMYFLNRKGWTFTNEELTDQLMDSIQNKGANYLYLYWSDVDPTGSVYSKKVYESDFLRVYEAVSH